MSDKAKQPFVCEHCQKEFKKAGGLGVHVKTKHPEAMLTDSQRLVYNMGRPSKYKPDYAYMLIDYFSIEKSTVVTLEKETKYSKDGIKTSEKEKYKIVPNDMPTFAGFARSIGVSHDTLLRWSEAVEDSQADNPKYKYPEFRVAYNTAKELQKEFLVDNGLKGNMPPASFIFVAKNVTDMTDKQIVETKDADYKDKEDALDNWFNTIRDHAKSTKRDITADEAASEDVQT